MSSANAQPHILGPVPALGRALVFRLRPERDPKRALERVRGLDAATALVGIGAPLALALGAEIPGLRTFPALSGPGCAFPSTQGALLVFVVAAHREELHARAGAVLEVLAADFALDEDVSTFRYQEGRDLTGYVDGTENPKDEAAELAALVRGAGPGHDGGSFVAVQRWIHDLPHFQSFAPETRDAIIGRRFEDDEEIEDAPAFSHVKRTAQESFDPPAFMVRRSMPFRKSTEEQGLFFVAYGESLDRFERMLRRMAGLEDGIVDGLLRFSRAASGGYYWCPPLEGGAFDLRSLG